MRAFRLAAALVAVALVAGPTACRPRPTPPAPAPAPGELGGAEEGVQFRAPEPKPIALRAEVPLAVERFEVHAIAPGSDVGAAGDLLITIHGRGFVDTSVSPRVELPDGRVLFDDTLVDLAGTQLFVVVPRQRLPELERLGFAEIAVHNPGGRREKTAGGARLEATPRLLLRPAAGAPAARLVFREGEFVRELTTP